MCTSITLQSKEKTSYIARTQDFNILLDDYIGIQIPRKHKVNTSVGDFVTRYSVMGLSALVQEAPLMSIPDGVNEFGLGGVTQRFSEYAKYGKLEAIESTGKHPLKSGYFLLWVLSQCKDTYEVEEKIKGVAIADIATFGDGDGEPRHFLFSDKAGRSIVVEPCEGLGFHVFENKVGVMTNSPDYPSQLAYLSNFTGLSNIDPIPKVMNGFPLESTGKGLGFVGMPGDYTSLSRFVRASYSLHYSETLNDKETIGQAFHLLSSVTIPKGAIKLPEEPEDQSLLYTQYQSVYDLTRQILYIKLYNNHRIQRIKWQPEQVNETFVQVYPLTQEEDFLDISK